VTQNTIGLTRCVDCAKVINFWAFVLFKRCARCDERVKEAVSITIGGRPVAVVADPNIPRDRGPIWVDWSRWETEASPSAPAEPTSTEPEAGDETG
jgi:hypothetical protein